MGSAMKGMSSPSATYQPVGGVVAELHEARFAGFQRAMISVKQPAAFSSCDRIGARAFQLETAGAGHAAAAERQAAAEIDLAAGLPTDGTDQAAEAGQVRPDH
jgi:hypothetical protein